MRNAFALHHAATAKAFTAGDHAKAMHHIGHMMMAVRTAAKPASSAPPSAPTNGTDGPDASQAMGAAQAGSDDDMSQSQSTAGVSTPPPMPSRNHFFGQMPAKAKSAPKAAPHVAGKGSPLTATTQGVSSGFNRARFSALKGK